MRLIQLFTLLSLLLSFNLQAQKIGSTDINKITLNEKPAILFCCWGRKGGEINLDYLKELQEKGFVVDYLDQRADMTWDRLKKYNAILLYDFPNRGKVTTSAHGSYGNGPDFDATMTLLRRYLKAGGGILINLQYPRRPKFYQAAMEALKEWGAAVPMDQIVVPKKSIFKHHRLHVPYMLTRNINQNTPVSQKIESVWSPQCLQHNHFPYAFKSGIIDVDDSWQVVVKAPKNSHTEPLLYDKIPPRQQIKNAYHLPTGTKEPALFAIRDKVDGGRLALFRMWPVFHVGSGKTFIHDGAVMAKGLNGVPSHFGRLLENTLHWLAAPSLKTGELGGATPAPSRFIDKNLKPEIRTLHSIPPKNDLSLNSPFKPIHLFKGVIGPRTIHSSGRGSVSDYAKIAKETGLDYIIFLEDFKKLTPESLKKLKEDCKKYSTDQLLLIPGFHMRTNLGNQAMFFGLDPEYPYDKILVGPDKKVYKLQNVDKKGNYLERPADSLRFNIEHFVKKGDSKGAWPNSVGYFDFARAREQGAPQLFDCRAFSMAGVLFYDNGKLIEDATDQYLLTNQGTMSAVPVAVNLLDSPQKLKEMVENEQGLTYAAARNLKRLWPDALSWNNQTKKLCVHPSNGPQIHGWGSHARTQAVSGTLGCEAYTPDWSLMIRELHVTSDKGLKEVAIYDGPKLWRRFLPHGEKEPRSRGGQKAATPQVFSAPEPASKEKSNLKNQHLKDFKVRLYLSSVTQKNLSVVATDIDGNKAVSFPLRCWKHGTLAPVFCGDHVNDCLFCNLQRGPAWQKLNKAPEVNNYGYTWDGGPKPIEPIFCLGKPLPVITTVEGLKQNRDLYQIPLLELCDEKTIRTTSIADRCLDEKVKGNSWTGYGPIRQAPLFKARSTSTEFIQASIGVDPKRHWFESIKTGPIPCFFEQKMTFLKDFTIKNLMLSYMWRKYTPKPGAIVVFGKDETIVEKHPLMELDEKTRWRYKVPLNGWFAGISPVDGNAQLYINNSENPLFLDINDKGNRLSAVPLSKPWKVETGEDYETAIFTMTWPFDEPIKNEKQLLRVIRYLKNPDGLRIKRGEKLKGPIGLQRLRADRYAVSIELPKPQEGLALTLACRVENLNSRWTSLEWLKKGYKGKNYYGDGTNRFRELGADEKGRVYFPIYAGMAPSTAIIVGHPVIADTAGKDLFIQVTCLSDREWNEKGKPLWHIAVNNPLDKPITSIINKNMDLPGLEDFQKQTLTLAPGERRIIYHQQTITQ